MSINTIICLIVMLIMIVVPIVALEIQYRKEEKQWKEYIEKFFMEKKKEEN